MTAHIIGGAVIGDSPATGVVDPWQRAYGHEGIHVVDGSAVSANLGVNNGDADPRPPLGSAYEHVAPVPPIEPTVPPTAPAALHLPIRPQGGSP